MNEDEPRTDRRSMYRQSVTETLVCPRCTAANRPGATYIELNDHGRAVCTVCAHVWIIKPATR